MDPFELDPMALIQAQAEKIVQLTNENVQLTAAVAQLRQQLTVAAVGDLNGEVSVSDDPTASITDITDEVAGAEITA